MYADENTILFTRLFLLNRLKRYTYQTFSSWSPPGPKTCPQVPQRVQGPVQRCGPWFLSDGFHWFCPQDSAPLYRLEKPRHRFEFWPIVSLQSDTISVRKCCVGDSNAYHYCEAYLFCSRGINAHANHFYVDPQTFMFIIFSSFLYWFSTTRFGIYSGQMKPLFVRTLCSCFLRWVPHKHTKHHGGVCVEDGWSSLTWPQSHWLHSESSI